MDERILNISGVRNIRSFKGYKNNAKEHIKRNAFIRSGNLENIDSTGIEQLKELKISLIIDLRSEGEVNIDKIRSLNYEYINIPMIDNIHSNIDGEISSDFPDSIENLYISLLEDSKDKIKKVFDLFADNNYKTILYNCFAGKDRTGIISMLLLGAVEIDNQTIIKDYNLSDKYFLSNIDEFNDIKIPKFLLESKPIYMENTIKYINKHYGSIRNYLYNIGINMEQINKIKEKLF